MELGQVRREAFPQPDRDRLGRRIAEAFDFIQKVVIEPRDERIDDPFEIGEVDQPSDPRIDRPAHGDLAAERMPVHAAALVSLRHIGQIMSGLESEILDQLNDVRISHLECILLARKN